MDYQISQSPFQTIPRKKLDEAFDDIRAAHSKNGVLTQNGAILTNVFTRYHEANIPVDYWYRDMDEFQGPKVLKKTYEKLSASPKEAFRAGMKARFAGKHGIGKMIDLETEIPTPDRGFLKLKELKKGDSLFDENGDICTLTNLHPIDESPESYKIIFDDGSVVNACADHLWLTYTLKDRRRDYLEKTKEKRRNQRRKEGKPHKPWLEKASPVAEPTVKTTKEILETLYVNGKQKVLNHSIPCTKPLNYDEKELPINPYVLGCWLGDGTASNGTITTADDKEILSFIKECGYNSYLVKSSEKDSKAKLFRIGELVKNCGKLRADLKDLNLIKNKHIPNEYLLASYEQRLALLQGLMDTDGSCTESGLSEFCSVTKSLAYGVLDIVRSLGIKATIKKSKSFLYNKRCQDRYRVTFTTELPVFKLSRKLKRVRHEKNQRRRTTHRFIKSVEPIKPIPMRCITVDSESHLFLVTRACIPTHNTMTVASILKRVVEHEYSALYVNLTDIIHVMLTSTQEDKTWARNQLLNTDFLVIDELDSRFMGSENAADLFGRILEPIIRTRIQNRMPLFICTNSTNVEDSFSGPLQASLESLMTVVNLVPVIGGKDARKLVASGEL